jgi:hypothetical protein
LSFQKHVQDSYDITTLNTIDEQNDKNNKNYKNENDYNQAQPASWGKYGPIMQNQQKGIKELPPVLTMKLVTNVKIQYTTPAESYNWYYCLKCAILPYGILLIPIEDFEQDKTLCPQNYYGKEIDPAHYTLMSHALYQLLDLDDTILRECTDITNLVKKHASATNGYQWIRS